MFESKYNNLYNPLGIKPLIVNKRECIAMVAPADIYRSTFYAYLYDVNSKEYTKPILIKITPTEQISVTTKQIKTIINKLKKYKFIKPEEVKK